MSHSGEEVTVRAVRGVAIGATALTALFALEYIAVGAAMPTIADDLDGYGLYNMAFGATVATGVLGMIAGGRWCDRSGPRPVVLAGAATFALGLLLAGFATSFAVFCVGRGVQGIGTGMANVALYVVIAQLVPDDVRPRVFSLLAAAWVLPGLVGPLLTGVVVEKFGWHWVFLGVTPLVLASVLVILPALRRTRPAGDSEELSRSVIVWAVVAAVAVGVLNLGTGDGGPLRMTFGLALLVVLALAAGRLLPRGTLALARGLPSIVAVRGALGGSFIAAEAYLPLLLRDEHGYSPAQAGAVLAVASVTWTVGSVVQGRMGPRTDRHRLMVVGAGLYAVSMVALTVGVHRGGPGWLVIVLYGVGILGVGLAYPTTTLVTMRLSRESDIGRHSAALQLAEALASASALAVTGVVFGLLYRDAPTAAFVGTLAVSLAVGLLAVVSTLRTRSS